MIMEVDLSWVDDFEAHLKRIRTEVVGFPVCFTGAVCDQWVNHMLYIYNNFADLIDDERGDRMLRLTASDHIGIVHSAYAALCMFGGYDFANFLIELLKSGHPPPCMAS